MSHVDRIYNHKPLFNTSPKNKEQTSALLLRSAFSSFPSTYGMSEGVHRHHSYLKVSQTLIKSSAENSDLAIYDATIKQPVGIRIRSLLHLKPGVQKGNSKFSRKISLNADITLVHQYVTICPCVRLQQITITMIGDSRNITSHIKKMKCNKDAGHF